VSTHEESSTEVEDEVDTCPLLHHLERGTEDGASEVRAWVTETAGEAGEPRIEVVGGGNHLLLVLVVGEDLSQFLLDIGGVPGLTTDAGERAGGGIDTTLLDVPTRGLGEEGETGTEDKSPDELDGDGDAVRARVGPVLRAVADT
jgi:hypothetical protein